MSKTLDVNSTISHYRIVRKPGASGERSVSCINYPLFSNWTGIKYYADIIALKNNPLENIKAAKSVHFVIKEGKIISQD